VEFDVRKPICHYFEEISKIPHGSKNERRLSDWLVAFAKERGLRFVQDELLNVVIYKPASVGYEKHPGVIIQAHMDMVCEKVPGSDHDFEKDPLELYVEGDHLRARGTTLGADDGMGCAYMLAILDDSSLAHPFLECCFTTQEEVGLVGAQALKAEFFAARRLINLDGAGEYRTYMSMGGGAKVALRKPFDVEPSIAPTYTLGVSGLLGGHSAGMIDKERANANKLAARILYRFFLEGVDLRLKRLDGGTKPNVIPSSAEAVFASEAPFERLDAIVAACSREFKEEFEFSDPGVTVRLSEPYADSGAAMTAKVSREAAELAYLLPYGQRARSTVIENLPIASCNLGVIATRDGAIEYEESVRSALESWIVEMEREVALFGSRYGASSEVSSYYPGWRYEEKSALRDEMKQVFEQMYGKPLLCLAGHGGNECGVFKRLYPDMDIVTSGAIYGSIHGTDEFLDLASFDRAYALLTTFLSRL
jgi:aminoacyl-histidine dipeptidase